MEPSSPRPSKSQIMSAITPWVCGARWYMGPPGSLTGDIAFSEVVDGGLFAWIIASDGTVRYNVPVLLRGDPAGEAASRADGEADGLRGSEASSWAVVDATADPAGQRILLDLIMGRIASPLSCEESTPLADVDSSTRLTSEQSNTSVIYTLEDSTRVILKVFRICEPGTNPDVELTRILDGTRTVPRHYGAAHLEVEGASGDVAVVQEFLIGARDAWQVIEAYLADISTHVDDDVATHLLVSIEDLGVMTRRIHTVLAELCPTTKATPEVQTELRDSWTERAANAIAACPELMEWEGTIATIYSATAHVQWPDLQRIHGDYHLGQVLRVPGEGWRALDFEGEPLRPLAERTHADLALRDVAGMLRSFDYAAGAAALQGGPREPLQAWATAAQAAFLRGYGDISEEESVLLEALLLDKALYEVTYELAQRPAWLPIPLEGVGRIVSQV